MIQITNLNFLNEEKIIKDQKDKYFIVRKIYINQSEQYAELQLLELNVHLSQWEIELPIACDKDFTFVSRKDKDFTFIFWETAYSKTDLIKLVLDTIKTKEDGKRETDV